MAHSKYSASHEVAARNFCSKSTKQHLVGSIKAPMALLMLLASTTCVISVCLAALASPAAARNIASGRDQHVARNHVNHNQVGPSGQQAQAMGQVYEPVSFEEEEKRKQAYEIVDKNRPRSGQDRCAPGWMWFQDKCLVATQSRRDFQHAGELCKKMYPNSTLPTIHSSAENDFLKRNINLHDSPIWLNARHNHQYNKTRWLDKSHTTFTNWDKGQPNDKSSLICIKTEDNWYMKKTDNTDGQTECVSFWEDGTWGTQVGCSVLLPVVCQSKIDANGNHNMNRAPVGAISEQSSMLSGASSINKSLMSSMPHLLTILTSISYFMILNGQSLTKVSDYGQYQRWSSYDHRDKKGVRYPQHHITSQNSKWSREIQSSRWLLER